MTSVHNQLITETNYANMARSAQQKADGKTSSSSVQSQDFLYLLTMQLQYQDPTNPMDNSEMLAQEAQFSTLEQMESLSSSFTKFSNAYQANSFLGQTVEATVDGKTTTGKVEYVDYSDSSGASVSIDGKMFPLSSITKVYPQDSNVTSSDDTNFLKEAVAYIADNIGSVSNLLHNAIGNNTNTTDNTTDGQ